MLIHHRDVEADRCMKDHHEKKRSETKCIIFDAFIWTRERFDLWFALMDAFQNLPSRSDKEVLQGMLWWLSCHFRWLEQTGKELDSKQLGCYSPWFLDLLLVMVQYADNHNMINFNQGKLTSSNLQPPTSSKHVSDLCWRKVREYLSMSFNVGAGICFGATHQSLQLYASPTPTLLFTVLCCEILTPTLSFSSGKHTLKHQRWWT